MVTVHEMVEWKRFHTQHALHEFSMKILRMHEPIKNSYCDGMDLPYEFPY